MVSVALLQKAHWRHLQYRQSSALVRSRQNTGVHISNAVSPSSVELHACGGGGGGDGGDGGGGGGDGGGGGGGGGLARQKRQALHLHFGQCVSLKPGSHQSSQSDVDLAQKRSSRTSRQKPQCAHLHRGQCVFFSFLEHQLSHEGFSHWPGLAARAGAARHAHSSKATHIEAHALTTMDSARGQNKKPHS